MYKGFLELTDGNTNTFYGLTYRIFVIWHFSVFGMLLALLSRTLVGINLPCMMESPGYSIILETDGGPSMTEQISAFVLCKP